MESFKVVLKTSGPSINGHFYSDEALKEIAKQMQAKELNVGEYEPPAPDADIKRTFNIDMLNIGVKYDNVRYEDGKLVADCTPIGNTVPKLIEADIKHSFALRAYGKSDKEKNIEPDSLKVVAFDITFNPDIIWPKD